MSINQTVVCDSCGKDLTLTDGRFWRLFLQPERTPAIPSTVVASNSGTARADANDPGHGVTHFCNHTCLASWATKEQARHDAAQTAHEAKLAEAVRIAAEKAKTEAAKPVA